VRELFWPTIDSDVAARTAAQNAMYVCLAIGVLNLLLPMAFGGNRLAAILTCLFYVFAAFGIRSFSWIAAVSALGIYGLGLIVSAFTLGLFAGVVGFIFFGLLIGGVRAVSFASRWRADHPDEDIRKEPLDGLGPAQRFFARLPLAFWPWARPLFVAYLALYALLLVVMINSVLFLRAVPVTSASMEPAIMYRERVIVLKSWVMGPLHRGDLVVFRMLHSRTLYEVSRIAGAPGDRLRLRGAQLILNGRPLAEPYARRMATDVNEYRDNFPLGMGDVSDAVLDTDAIAPLKANIRNGEFVVPGGCYFVLGDNRDYSFDSRYIGPLPENDITGRPILVSGAKRGLRSLPRIRIGD
jgi:signal peptidase I